MIISRNFAASKCYLNTIWYINDKQIKGQIMNRITVYVKSEKWQQIYIYTLFMGRTQEVNAIDLFSEEEKKKEKKKCGK